KEERLPAKVSCGIHPWMTAWVLVVDDTYNAVTKEDGSFEISGLPEGEELEFQVWQEKGGYTDQITCEKFPDGWSRGRFKMTFSGDVDLGEIKVSPDEFK
ncbi:MAG: methylamine utilization protein, partial [Pirellulales bacterium]